MRPFSLLSLLLMISCTPNEYDFQKRWMSTFYIKQLHKFEWGKPVNKPENTKVALMEVRMFSSGGFKTEVDCVFAQLPYKGKDGVLYISRKKRAFCKQQLFDSMERVLDFDKLVIKVDKSSLKLVTEKVTKKLYLPNLEQNIPKFMENYKSGIKKTYLAHGVSERPIVLKAIPKLSDLVFEKRIAHDFNRAAPFSVSAKKCHSVDARCRSKKEFTCDECPNGFVEVVGGLCANGGDKYCAPIGCGGIGQLACYRGKVHTEGPKKLACQNDSVEGFCNFGLKTYCNNGKLFCR